MASVNWAMTFSTFPRSANLGPPRSVHFPVHERRPVNPPDVPALGEQCGPQRVRAVPAQEELTNTAHAVGRAHRRAAPVARLVHAATRPACLSADWYRPRA